MAGYVVWLLANNYDKLLLVRNLKHLMFHLTLNGIGAMEDLSVPANDEVIPFLPLMRRLVILRDGSPIWGGQLQFEAWADPPRAPEGTTYSVQGLDHAHYAQRRILKANDGTAYDEANDHADDDAKYYVRRNLGTSAAAARQMSDLTVDADLHQCTTVRKRWRGQQLLERLQALATEQGFYWRFVPTMSGCTFTTRYPLWGADRSRGNGVNRECIFSFDRRNTLSMSYRGDVSEHYNFVYVAGEGEGAARLIVERSDATAIATYDRREIWIDARNNQGAGTTQLQQEGDEALAKHKAQILLTAAPAVGTFKSIWDLGDKVSIRARKFSRDYSGQAIITSVAIEIGEDGVERAAPTMEAV